MQARTIFTSVLFFLFLTTVQAEHCIPQVKHLYQDITGTLYIYINKHYYKVQPYRANTRVQELPPYYAYYKLRPDKILDNQQKDFKEIVPYSAPLAIGPLCSAYGPQIARGVVTVAYILYNRYITPPSTHIPVLPSKSNQEPARSVSTTTLRSLLDQSYQIQRHLQSKPLAVIQAHRTVQPPVTIPAQKAVPSVPSSSSLPQPEKKPATLPSALPSSQITPVSSAPQALFTTTSLPIPYDPRVSVPIPVNAPASSLYIEVRPHQETWADKQIEQFEREAEHITAIMDNFIERLHQRPYELSTITAALNAIGDLAHQANKLPEHSSYTAVLQSQLDLVHIKLPSFVPSCALISAATDNLRVELQNIYFDRQGNFKFEYQNKHAAAALARFYKEVCIDRMAYLEVLQKLVKLGVPYMQDVLDHETSSSWFPYTWLKPSHSDRATAIVRSRLNNTVLGIIKHCSKGEFSHAYNLVLTEECTNYDHNYGNRSFPPIYSCKSCWRQHNLNTIYTIYRQKYESSIRAAKKSTALPPASAQSKPTPTIPALQPLPTPPLINIPPLSPDKPHKPVPSLPESKDTEVESGEHNPSQIKKPIDTTHNPWDPIIQILKQRRGCNWSKQRRLPSLKEIPQTNTPPPPIVDAQGNTPQVKPAAPLETQQPGTQDTESNNIYAPKEPNNIKIPSPEELQHAQEQLKKAIQREVLKELKRLEQAAPELSKKVQEYLKKYKANQSGPRCPIHKVITRKGKHSYRPAELEKLIISDIDLAKLVKAFDYTLTTPIECGCKAALWIDYEHLFRPCMKIDCQKQEIELSGFHHDHLHKIRNSGLIEFINYTEEPNGIYKAKWSYNNTKPKDSTFFPADWSPAKVIEKIIEACQNPITKPEYENGCWQISGITKENIEIFIVFKIITSNSQGIAKLVTAYPTIKKENL